MKKNLRRTLAVFLSLLMLVGVTPMNVLAATGKTEFYQETKEKYKYEVLVTTLNDANDWKAATVKFINAGGTSVKDVDIKSYIDHNDGSVHNIYEDNDYLKEIEFYYKIGAGNREWSGNVVIKVNGVTVYNETQKVTSEWLSAGDMTYTIKLPKTQPKTVIFYSKDENGNKSADLTFKQPLDAEEGQLIAPIYTEAQSQFSMAWHNWTEKTAEGDDVTTIVSTSDPTTDTAQLGDDSGEGMTVNLKSTSGIDHTGHYTLTWDTKVGGVPVYEHPFDVDFLFWHKVNQKTTGNGTVELSAEKAYTGDKVTVTATPEEGYALTSLSVVDADGNEVELSGNQFTMPNSKVSVNANFAPMDYTAIFVADGKTVAMIPYTVETATIVEPAVPEKAGYHGAWESYTLKNGGVTVNAVYTPITYTAKFDADGKTVAEIPYTVETTEIEEPAVPEKPGYTGAWAAYTLALGGVVVEANYEKEFHDFRVTSSTPATCTEEGYDTYTCTICGDSYRVTTTPATGHVYKVTASSPATCTAEGYDTYTCSVCGEIYTKTTTPATGHTYKVTDSTPATCTAEGYDTYTCEDCGEAYYQTTTPALGHAFTLKTDTVAATCTEEGYEVYQCERCDATYERVTTPATGHSYKVTASESATCTAEGSDTYTCSVCGETYTKTTTPATGHSYKVTASTPATCTAEGSDTYTCENCGKTYDKTIPVVAHQFAAVDFKDATCTEAGYTTYKCLTCEETFRGDYVPAAGHRFVADVVAPTCAQDGYTCFTCEVCGETRKSADGSLYKTNITKAVQHVMNTVTYVAPTCGKSGKKVSECVNCGYVQKEVIPATGKHRYSETVVKAATCSRDGVMRHTCKLCGASYKTVIPATGEHNYDGTLVIKNAAHHRIKPSYVCTKCGKQQALVLNGWCKHPETGKWMFLENNTRRLGWLHIPTPFDQWYYLGKDGYMVTGWQKINRQWYYFDAYGVMQTGWKKLNGKWYYLNENGALTTGWKKLDGQWYYFNRSGAMRTAKLSYQGKTYRFASSGACLNP